jgi:Tol biopolymer transport system component
MKISGLPAGAGTCNQPRFSPSGEIAFTYFASGGSNFDVWITSPAGTNARPIANSTMRESAPDWSPDGAYIAYVRSPALNVNEIVIARVSDGSIVRTIPEPPGGTVNNPRWGLIR